MNLQSPSTKRPEYLQPRLTLSRLDVGLSAPRFLDGHPCHCLRLGNDTPRRHFVRRYHQNS